MTTFTLPADAAFSLAAAAAFGAGASADAPQPGGARMRLAFVADDLEHQIGVSLREEADGTIAGEVQGEADITSVRRQVARILCLDHPGSAWLAVGERDPIIGRLQERFPGVRPVLFHSPYEAAAWSIIATRKRRRAAAAARTHLATAAGRRFTVDGEDLHAFPLPRDLLAVGASPGLDATRIERLHAVARAALDGLLEPRRLAGMDQDAALAQLQRLPGIGPLYATLVLLRATGATDALIVSEPRFPGYVARLYATGPAPATEAQIDEIAERWRPLRTWAMVLIRMAGDRSGVSEIPGTGDA